MLKQLKLSVQQDQNNLELIYKHRQDCKKKLKEVQDQIVMKKDIDSRFTEKQLDKHTECIKEIESIQLAQTISQKFIQFLDLLTIPFTAKKDEIYGKVLEILQSQNIDQYQKEITHALHFRLQQYSKELDQKNHQIVLKFLASKSVPAMLNAIPPPLEEKEREQFIEIIVIDSNLSRAYQELNCLYESKLLTGLFNKIYDTIQKTTILHQPYSNQQIKTLLYHIQCCFSSNNSLFSHIFGDHKSPYFYTIKQLYRTIAVKHCIRIINMYKDACTNKEVGELVNRMLELESKLKGVLEHEKDILGKKESMLLLIFESDESILQRIVKSEKETLSEIVKDPKSNILDSAQLQQRSSTFTTWLKSYYEKYIDLPQTKKTEINREFAELTISMIKASLSDIDSIMNRKENLEAKYGELESFAIIQSWYNENIAIKELRKNNKGIEEQLQALRKKINDKIQKLIEEEYSVLRKRLPIQQPQKLYEQYQNLSIQKKQKVFQEMFIQRMRHLFFKFIKKEESFTKKDIKNLLDVFEPFLEMVFRENAREIRKVIDSGNVLNQYKTLSFLRKDEREAIAKFKLN